MQSQPNNGKSERPRALSIEWHDEPAIEIPLRPAPLPEPASGLATPPLRLRPETNPPFRQAS